MATRFSCSLAPDAEMKKHDHPQPRNKTRAFLCQPRLKCQPDLCLGKLGAKKQETLIPEVPTVDPLESKMGLGH